MSRSVSFDRAAGYYDETRSLPDAQMEVLVSRLVAEIPRGGTCLEIGIGTGRVALPLLERGVEVVGVDISAEMLHRFLAKRPGARVAIADATHLPFAGGTFTSAIAAHVLHLIPHWQKAVDELARVLVPGGVFLASKGSEARAEWQNSVRRRFFAEAGDPPWPPGIVNLEQLDEHMRDRGAQQRKVEDVRAEHAHTITDLVAALEQGIYAACWSLDEETRRRAAAATRAWAREEYGDLDEPRFSSHRSDWRAYRLP